MSKCREEFEKLYKPPLMKTALGDYYDKEVARAWRYWQTDEGANEMSILSEEQKEGLRNGACDDYFEARPQIDSLDRRRVFEAGFDRACKVIEAAVLEAQAEQEPVAWRYKIIPPGWTYSEKKPSRDFAGDAWDRWEVTPLYAAPVVQPDMVMVPREPTIEMREALQVGTGATFLETKTIYRRLLAAAEGKK